MHPYTLFQRTLEELVSLTDGSGDEYDLIQCSALLRRLLTDSPPLLEKANAEVRMKIFFDLNVMSDLPGVSPTWRWVNPEFAKDLGDRPRGKLAAFLACPVIELEGVRYTVKNVIRCAAHVMGGVHNYKPEDEREERLYAMNDAIRIGHAGMVAKSVEGIGLATIDALTPLAEALRARGG